MTCPRGANEVRALANDRVAQTFTAPVSGQLTSADIPITGVGAGADIRVEIRTLDGSGVPTPTVLASDQIDNLPATPLGEVRTLTATFAPAASVQAGTELRAGPDDGRPKNSVRRVHTARGSLSWPGLLRFLCQWHLRAVRPSCRYRLLGRDRRLRQCGSARPTHEGGPAPTPALPHDSLALPRSPASPRSTSRSGHRVFCA